MYGEKGHQWRLVSGGTTAMDSARISVSPFASVTPLTSVLGGNANRAEML